MSYTKDSASLELPDLAKKNARCTVKFKLQINNVFF